MKVLLKSILLGIRPLSGPLVGVTAALGLSACAVIPTYKAPTLNLPDSYTARHLPARTQQTDIAQGGESQHFSKTALPAQWWRAFHSPQLNALISTAFAHNPSLSAARQTLSQYRHLARAADAAFWPNLGADLTAKRQRIPVQFPGQQNIYGTFSSLLNVSYAPDVFGRTGYHRASTAARVRRADYEVQGTYESLAGHLTTATIQAAGYQAQIDATYQILADQQRVLVLVRLQYHLGATSYTNVLTQHSQIATTQANLYRLKQARAITRHQLAILTGAFPANFKDHIPALDQLILPSRVPLSLPSTLIQRRPDVRAAEAAVRAAYAQYGLADAERFPSFALTGAFGRNAPKLDNLGESSFNFWSLALNASVTLFDAGALKENAEAASAAYRAAADHYRNTVLIAFQQVANSLWALENDAKILHARKAALTAANGSLKLARDQYRLGSIGFQTLLSVQIEVSQSRIAFLQALVQRYLDTATLYVALGGQSWPLPQTIKNTHHS